jgi:hypothetical protein
MRYPLPQPLDEKNIPSLAGGGEVGGEEGEFGFGEWTCAHASRWSAGMKRGSVRDIPAEGVELTGDEINLLGRVTVLGDQPMAARLHE